MAMVWSIGILLVLLILLILYFLGTFHRQVMYRMRNIPGLKEPHFPIAVVGLSDSLLTRGHSTGFWIGAEAIHAARLEAIQTAQSTIHFETFYMTPGRRANDFAAAVIERAEAGVRVQLIVDDHGVQPMPKKYWKRLQAARVEVCFFNEFDWGAPLNYLARTHRKLLLIDGNVAFIGGAGISDDWDGTQEGDTAPWLDFEVRFEGLVVPILEGIFMQQWVHAGGIADLSSKLFNPTVTGGSTILVTPGDDPSYSDSSISTLFYMSILAASQRVWVASPYFLPDNNLRQALQSAKKNGVDVRILTMGPHNDKNYVYHAARELYGSLLRVGVEVYEYQPSMMHAKVLLLDDDWVSTGSANFDPRSSFHNDELHLSISQLELTKKLEEFFTVAFSQSQRVNLANWRKRPIHNRILGRLVLSLRRQL